MTQNLLSNHLKVLRRGNIPLNKTELGFFTWAARYVYFPHEKIYLDPVRVFDPATSKVNNMYLESYKKYLQSKSNASNESNEEHFVRVHASSYVDIAPAEIRLTRGTTSERIGIVSHILRRILSKHGSFFGKSPKYLHDCSGKTLELISELAKTEKDIEFKIIFQYRNPLDVYSSQLERRLRCAEIFAGVFDDPFFSYTEAGIIAAYERGWALKDRMDILAIRYEDILDNPNESIARLFSFLGKSLDCVDLDLSQRVNRKYRNRFIIDPLARRETAGQLASLARVMGYDIPEQITGLDVLREYLFTLGSLTKSVEYQNNAENLGSFARKMVKNLRQEFRYFKYGKKS